MNILQLLKEQSTQGRIRLLHNSSLLLLPRVGDDAYMSVENEQEANRVITEIRSFLKIQNDLSLNAITKILAFLSDQLSISLLEGVDLSSVESRLAEKGVLHPSRYEVYYGRHIELLEALGTKRSHFAEAIGNPDLLLHMKPHSLTGKADPRLTISIKYVKTKRVEDNFVLIVFSQRVRRGQLVVGGFRAYLNEVDLQDANEPLDFVRSFVKSYGLLFRVGDSTRTRLLENEIITLNGPLEGIAAGQGMIIDDSELQIESDHFGWPFLSGDLTGMAHPNERLIAEILLAFVIDTNKYIETLRRHGVTLAHDLPNRMKRFLVAINR